MEKFAASECSGLLSCTPRRASLLVEEKYIAVEFAFGGTAGGGAGLVIGAGL